MLLKKYELFNFSTCKQSQKTWIQGWTLLIIYVSLVKPLNFCGPWFPNSRKSNWITSKISSSSKILISILFRLTESWTTSMHYTWHNSETILWTVEYEISCVNPALTMWAYLYLVHMWYWWNRLYTSEITNIIEP